MKIRTSIFIAILFLLNGIVHATASGMYLGIMLGPATNTAQQVPAQVAGSTARTMVTARSNQYGGRLFVGNKLTPYAGWEAGMSVFSATRYDNKGVSTCSSLSSRVRAFDLVVKGEYPIRSFDVFAKAGVALVRVQTSGAFNRAQAGDDCGKPSNETRPKPTVTVGASYDFSPSWIVDASWSRIAVGGVIKNIDLYALGISYHFVDRYCGQFLCD